MTDPFQWYLILLVAGLLLILVEFFIPGGILGLVGGIAMMAAIGVGFSAFGPTGGIISAISIIIGSIVLLALWIKYCPKSALGRMFTLETDGSTFKSSDNPYEPLVGKTGKAVSDLRPSGIATVEGQRVDVVSEAGFIEQDSDIVVLKAEGNRVVVRQADPA